MQSARGEPPDDEEPKVHGRAVGRHTAIALLITTSLAVGGCTPINEQDPVARDLPSEVQMLQDLSPAQFRLETSQAQLLWATYWIDYLESWYERVYDDSEFRVPAVEVSADNSDSEILDSVNRHYQMSFLVPVWNQYAEDNAFVIDLDSAEKMLAAFETSSGPSFVDDFAHILDEHALHDRSGTTLVGPRPTVEPYFALIEETTERVDQECFLATTERVIVREVLATPQHPTVNSVHGDPLVFVLLRYTDVDGADRAIWLYNIAGGKGGDCRPVGG